MIRVAIIGASGYTGAESTRILFRHGQAELTYLTALPEECGPVEEVFPEFRGRCGLAIEPLDLDKLSQLADVALYLLQLASVAEIDLEKAILDKIEANWDRTWSEERDPA